MPINRYGFYNEYNGHYINESIESCLYSFEKLNLYKNKLTPMPFIVGTMYLYIYLKSKFPSIKQDDVSGFITSLELFIYDIDSNLGGNKRYRVESISNDIVLSYDEKNDISNFFFTLVKNSRGLVKTSDLLGARNFIIKNYDYLNVAFFTMINPPDPIANVISGRDSVLIQQNTLPKENIEIQVRRLKYKELRNDLFSEDTFNILKGIAKDNYNYFIDSD